MIRTKKPHVSPWGFTGKNGRRGPAYLRVSVAAFSQFVKRGMGVRHD